MSALLLLAQAAHTVLSHHLVRRQKFYGVAGVAGIAVLAWLLILAPLSFPPSNAPFEVREGASAASVAQELEDQGLIHSSFVFQVIARLTGASNTLHAGEYLFAHPIGMLEIMWRLTNGMSGIDTVSVTFPEGITVREMGEILADHVSEEDADTFGILAARYEGFLFPDTYQIYPNTEPEELIERMRDRYTDVWAEVSAQYPTTESEERIVTMASILEKETKVGEDRALVSGILWSRIEIGMPLQVDAVFGYIYGTDTFHPSGEDLEVDSPYNTYKNRDLPPGAIGNPGKDALIAALNPAASPYLYYLSGTDGRMHYAETFEEHKANKEAYLR